MILKPMTGNSLVYACGKLRTLFIKTLDHRLIAIDRHSGNRRGHGMGFRPMRRGKQKDAGEIRMVKPAKPHIFGLARERRNGKAIAERLSETGKVRHDTIKLLRAAHMPAKAGNHFIQNEKCTVFMGNAHGFMEKIVLRLVCARRLHDDGGDAPRIVLEKRLDTGNIIIAKRRGERRNRRGNACAHLRGANEPVVGRKEGMVGAAGHHVTPCIGAGKAKRAGSRIRAVLAEFDHFRPLNQFEKAFRAVEFDSTWPGKIAAILQGLAYGSHHRRIGMAEADGAVSHPIFDIFVAIHVEDMGA
ncbi:Uncharacterised protein [Brucella neotomae]|nr:Uncharacterised protein [Brucella neotomae]